LILEYILEYPDRAGLIIVDYRMFPMQGSELTNEIAVIIPKIKMILLMYRIILQIILLIWKLSRNQYH